MPQFQYGQTSFEWRYQLEAQLKRHYVTVERGLPVLLRGPLVAPIEQEALIRRRARWIREKLAQVNQPQAEGRLHTGNRLAYAGRTYFTQMRHVPGLSEPALHFTASRFVIDTPTGASVDAETASLLLGCFYTERAEERLPARVRHWQRLTGLQASGVLVRVFQSRWASCDARNVLLFHPRVMALSASALDYVILHELCHTLEKGHTRAFWALLASHMPAWRQHHDELAPAAF